MSVSLQNTPLAKFIQIYILNLSAVFSISPLVEISMVSLISSLCMVKTSLNLPQKSSGIFGHLQKMFGNAHVTFG